MGDFLPSFISFIFCIIMLISYKKTIQKERERADRVYNTMIELLRQLKTTQEECNTQINRFHSDVYSYLNNGVKQNSSIVNIDEIREILKLQQEQTELLRAISQGSNSEESKKLQDKWKQLSEIMNSLND